MKGRVVGAHFAVVSDFLEHSLDGAVNNVAAGDSEVGHIGEFIGALFLWRRAPLPSTPFLVVLDVVLAMAALQGGDACPGPRELIFQFCHDVAPVEGILFISCDADTLRSQERMMDLMNERHDDLLRLDDTVCLVVDMQERLLPVIHDQEKLQRRIVALLGGLNALNIPVIFTEHYSKGLGKTASGIAQALGDATCIEKETFSCMGEPRLVDALRATERSQVVVVGIEAHICVLQTVLDLVAEGFTVHCPADGVSSRLESARSIGLSRMERQGVTVTTAESVLFELLQRANTAAFRSVLPFVRDPE